MSDYMKKVVDTLEEASAIVDPMLAENKWAITVTQNAEGKFIIEWMENKMYVAQDGKEYRDEVWTTKEGKMILIQDLETEHAKNIIRMMLRQEREAKQQLDSLYDRVAETLGNMMGGEQDDDQPDSPYQVPGSTTLQ